MGRGSASAVLAVVLEEAGRALLPEPLLLSSVLGVRAVLAAPAGACPTSVVSGVVEGRLVVTVALEHDADTDLTLSDDAGSATVSGRRRPGAARRDGRPGGRRHRTSRDASRSTSWTSGPTAWPHAPRSRSSTSPAARPGSTSTAPRHT